MADDDSKEWVDSWGFDSERISNRSLRAAQRVERATTALSESELEIWNLVKDLDPNDDRLKEVTAQKLGTTLSELEIKEKDILKKLMLALRNK